MQYRGKSKEFTKITDSRYSCKFLDNITAFNGKKSDIIIGKGAVLNEISSIFMKMLHECNIKNHYIKKISSDTQEVLKLNMIPIEVVVRKYAHGSFSRRFNIPSMTRFNSNIFELFLKSDELDDPMISFEAAVSLGYATKDQLKNMIKLSCQIADCISSFLYRSGILFIDSKFEFGVYNNEIYLGDEITPESSRFVDISNNTQIDKDIYRKNGTDNILKAYESVLEKITIK